MSFNYDPDYEAGEKNTDDKVVWKYYEIENNDAETIWNFYNIMIFSSFSIPSYRRGPIPVLEEVNGRRNAYYMYYNEYDERLTAKAFSPAARKEWNRRFANPSINDEFDEDDLDVHFIYYQNDEELSKVDFDLNEIDELGKMYVDFEKDGIKYQVEGGGLTEEGIISFNQKSNKKNINNQNREYIPPGFLSIYEYVEHWLNIGLLAAEEYYPFLANGDAKTGYAYRVIDGRYIYKIKSSHTASFPLGPFAIWADGESPAISIIIRKDESGDIIAFYDFIVQIDGIPVRTKIAYNNTDCCIEAMSIPIGDPEAPGSYLNIIRMDDENYLYWYSDEQFDPFWDLKTKNFYVWIYVNLGNDSTYWGIITRDELMAILNPDEEDSSEEEFN